MATVYRAHDRRLDRTVALKLMHAHLADSPDFVSRFRREARAAARLSNPGVVAVFDQGSLDGVAYLVMEYVEGPTLRDLIAAGPLSVKEALGLVAQTSSRRTCCCPRMARWPRWPTSAWLGRSRR